MPPIEYEKLEEIYLQTLKTGPNSKIEHLIAKSGHFSCLYAINVLQTPFPLGEPAIAKSSKFIIYSQFLKQRFKLCEPNILYHYSLMSYLKYIMNVNHDK